MTTAPLIFPDFQHNLVNLSATLQAYLGIKPHHATLPVVEQALKHQPQQVVYLVIDAMGAQILAKNLPATSFLRSHQRQTITSVFPSTTAAATTTIVSAQTPGEHGWFAWSVDFDGEVIELFRNRNYYTKQFTTDPQFVQHHLPYPLFFDSARANRPVYALMPDRVSYRMPVPNYLSYRRLSGLYRRLHRLLKPGDPKFVYAYYSQLDSMMHRTGTASWRARHLLRKIDRFCAKLAKRHPETTFIITADHGQIDVAGHVPIYNDPKIMDCLAHPISMDPRGACFHVKPGCHAQFERAFQAYAADFTLFKSADLIQRGVFGPVKPDYVPLLGDYIAIGTDTNKILMFTAEKKYRGHHTGLTKDEVDVPVIIAGAGA